MNDYILIEELKKNWKILLSRIKWDLFLTFTFENNPKSFSNGYYYISKYFKEVKKYYNKTQFSGLTIGLIDKHNINKTIHYHSLIKSNPNYPVVLNEINYKEIIFMENIWNYGRIDIQVISNQEGINNYIASKNIRYESHDEYQIFLYRKNLLMKYMRD